VTFAARRDALATPAAARGSLREVAGLAWPVIVSQMSSTLMGVVDIAMVGRLGATELAAVGFAHIWTWTLFSLFIGTASGVQTFVAQHHGAGDEARCGAWVWHALGAIVPAAAGAAALLGASAPLWLAALGPSPALQAAALEFLPGRLLGLVGTTVAFSWASFFRGIGDTRTPMLGAVLANGVNAVLAYGLIFGELGFPQLGVAGSGAAMAVGEWTLALFLGAAALRHSVRARYGTGPILARAASLRRVLRTGLPIGGQWVLDMSAFAVFTTLVARMGDASMAASQAFISLLSLSFMQASGLSVAAATLVGRYVGAGDPAAAERSFRTALGLAGALGGFVALLFLAVPEALLGLFTRDADVLALGGPLLALGAAFQLLDALGITSSGALRGAGDTRWPFLVQAALAWFVFLPAAWLCGITFDGGLTGAWAGGLVYVAGLAVAFVWRFRAGVWRGIRI
jgi:MATE family multidrug resistance protein